MGLSFECRVRQTDIMCMRHPDKVPVMLDEHGDAGNQLALKKKKFMIPRNVTCAQFIVMIRERIQLHPTQTLFFMTVPKHHLICGTTTIGELYDKEKNDDGFLYVVYAFEHSFGSFGRNGNCSMSAQRYKRSMFLPLRSVL